MAMVVFLLGMGLLSGSHRFFIATFVLAVAYFTLMHLWRDP